MGWDNKGLAIENNSHKLVIANHSQEPLFDVCLRLQRHP